MGSGVFEDDFYGTGKTFCVSTPYYSEEDHKLRVAEFLSDHPDPDKDGDFHVPDYWQSSADTYDLHNENLIISLERAAEELDFDVISRKGFRPRYDRDPELDKDFVSIAENGLMAIGWRSWENDLIVGVGAYRGGDPSPQEMLGEDSKHYGMEIFSAYGLTQDKAVEMFDRLSGLVFDYVKTKCLANGLECSFKTSGQTSSQYKLEENYELEQESRKAEIKSLVDTFNGPSLDNILSMGESDRAKMICLIDEQGSSFAEYLMVTPVFDKSSTPSVKLVCISLDANGSGEVINDSKFKMPDIPDFPCNDQVGAVPYCKETADWFAELQKQASSVLNNWRRDIIVVGAQEYANATKSELIINAHVLDGDADDLSFRSEFSDEDLRRPTPGLAGARI